MDEEKKEPGKPSKKKGKELPPSDEEVEVMLTRLNELRRNLERKLDDLYGSKGLTYKEIDEYLKNKANFTEKEWEQLEKRRKEVKKEMEEKLAAGPLTKKKKISKKKGIRKLRGPRKGWMKMD